MSLLEEERFEKQENALAALEKNRNECETGKDGIFGVNSFSFPTARLIM